jgi:hypothetical protein
LKYLDSDERIQGNPRESKPVNRCFHHETGRNQENPNGSTRAGMEPTRLHPKAKRLVPEDP